MPPAQEIAEPPPIELILDRRGHTFIIRYQPGEEAHILEALSSMVAHPRIPFDWFDAAVMSHQMAHQCRRRLQAGAKP
jgi:hypothetical protein